MLLRSGAIAKTVSERQPFSERRKVSAANGVRRRQTRDSSGFPRKEKLEVRAYAPLPAINVKY